MIARSLRESFACWQRARHPSHLLVPETRSPVRGRDLKPISDKGAPDIVLIDGAERSGNEAPQPGEIARGVGIAGDNSRTKDREALEADRLNSFFLHPHDADV